MINRPNQSARTASIVALAAITALLCGCPPHQKPTPPPKNAQAIKGAFPPPAPTVAAVDYGPLAVVRVNPEKDKDVVQSVSVTFNQPVVPLTDLDALDKLTPPLSVEPKVKGRFRWLGTKTISFVPDEPLTPATTFKATVPAGSTGISGVPMAQDHTWTFETRRPKVISSTPYGHERWALPESTIVLQFNQPVDPASVAKHLRVTAAGRPIEFDAVRRDKGTTGAPTLDKKALANRRIELKPRPRLPLDSPIQVSLSAGVVGVEGPLPSKTPYSTSFRTYGPLSVDPPRCWRTPCSVRGDVHFRFSNPLHADARKLIKVTPALPEPNALNISGNGVYIYGQLKPDTQYRVTFPAAIEDAFGQRLGKTVTHTFRTGDYAPALEIENQIVVLESAGASQLAGQFINVPQANLAVVPLQPNALGTAIDWLGQAQQRSWDINWRPDMPRFAKHAPRRPVGVGGARNTPLDKALDLAPDVKKRGGHGLFLVSLQADVNNPRWSPYKLHDESIVQVTDLGLQLWYDYDQMLVWLTRLSDTSQVGGAELTIYDRRGAKRWSGSTDAKGVAITPGLNSLGGSAPYTIVAAKNGDTAFVRAVSDTMPGGQWLYHYSNNSPPPTPKRLTGHLFSERGIYRPGEQVEMKGLLRLVDRDGIHALPEGIDKASIAVVTARGETILETEVALTDHDSFHLTIPLSPKATLGSWRVIATPKGLQGVRPTEVNGNFQVQAYRAPEFMVSAKIDKEHHLPGETLKGRFEGRYLFGAPMRDAQSNWTIRATQTHFHPKGHTGYSFGGRLNWKHRGNITIGSGGPKLDKTGVAQIALPLKPEWADGPQLLSLSVEVIDANRQSVASRASALLHPASAYFGLKTKRSVYKAGEKIDIDAISVDPEGEIVAGIGGTIALERQEWKQISEKKDGRLVTRWETSWPEEARCAVTTAQKPAKCTLTPKQGGYFRLHASGKDAKGRTMTTVRYLWVAGPNYKPRDDERKIGLVLDKALYKVGDTARLLITSPFPKGRALLTMSRLGLVEHRDLGEIGGNELVEIPIEASALPNLRLGVAVVKARKGAVPRSAKGDDNRPEVLSNAINLRVDTSARKIGVEIKPAKAEIRPGTKTTVEIRTTAPDGSPMAAEVMVAAVDEGVLSLIGYTTPDPLAVIWKMRDAELAGQDLRRWLSRGEPKARLTDAQHVAPRQQGAKGSSAAGIDKGGGKRAKTSADAPAVMAPAPEEARRERSAKRGPKAKAKEEVSAQDMEVTDGRDDDGDEGDEPRVRSRFATTAFYTATVKTDANGFARVELDMPDNLTTFRVMAVANDPKDQFGSGQNQITVRQPLLLRAALPRFTSFGDRFLASVVVNNETGEDGELSIDLGVEGQARLTGESRQTGRVAKGAAAEFTFPVETPEPGLATFTFKAALTTASGAVFKDAVQGKIPVQRPITTESVAVYGTTEGAVAQALAPPGDALPGVGGLEVTLSSTMLTNLQDAIEYLVEYPYGCLEQTSSRVLPLLVLRELVVRYNIAGLDGDDLDAKANAGIARIIAMQRYSGGFAFWPQGQRAYAWPSIYAMFVLNEARKRDKAIPEPVWNKAVGFLERVLTGKVDPETGHPLGPTTLSFAAAVLADIDPARVDMNRDLKPLLAAKDAMPLFGRAYLVLAYVAKGGDPAAIDTLMGDLSNNAVEESSDAHFAEPKADSFAEFFHSDSRTDAIVLMAYLKTRPDDPLVPKTARGLMEARVKGRWANTQENAYALLALDRFVAHYEKERPDYTARLWLGEELLLEQKFEGRDTKPVSDDVPMRDLQANGADQIVLAKEGPGRLYYRLGMTYAPSKKDLPARESGFTILRRYEAIDPADQTGEGQDVSVKAGRYVRVHLTFVVPTERHWVVVNDPMPAGVEAVNLNLKTSLDTLSDHTSTKRESYWGYFWRAPFDHTEMRDDRVLLFADRLLPGVYEHSYVVRTTTMGDFHLPPASISEMYQPEVFGRTSSASFKVVE